MKYLLTVLMVMVCTKVFAYPVNWTKYNNDSIYNMCANKCSPNVATTGQVDTLCLIECTNKVNQSNLNFRVFKLSPTSYIGIDNTTTYVVLTYNGSSHVQVNGTEIASFVNLADAQIFFDKYMTSHYTIYTK